MQYFLTTLNSCSPQLYQKLLSLNFRDEGKMYWELTRHRQLKFDALVSYAKQGNKLISWALGFHGYRLGDDKKLTIFTYTRKTHRKCGIGYKVIRQLEEYCRLNGKTIVYEPWDENSNIFFTKCLKYSPVKVELRYLAPPSSIIQWKCYEDRH